jgi:outer membrane protein assembly factor BamB
LRAANGEERWSAQLDFKITAAPTMAGDTVLIRIVAGILFGLDANTGDLLWEYQTGGEIFGSPIVAVDTIFVPSQHGKLYAIVGQDY